MKTSTKAILAFLAITLTATAMWLTNKAATPNKSAWDDVIKAAQRGGYRLISTNDVWQRFNDNRENMLLVDTRQAWEYRTGHIKGAVNYPMNPTWLGRWRSKGNLGTILGPDKNRSIVFY